MDRLDSSQSAFLNRLLLCDISVSELSKEEKIICRFLKEQGYISYKISSKASYHDGISSLGFERQAVSISESGKMYLENERSSREQYLLLVKQMESAKHMADSAQRLAESAQQQVVLAQRAAEQAKEQARSASKDALISRIIAILSLICSLLFQTPFAEWLRSMLQ